MSSLWGLHTAADPTLPPAFGEDTNVVHRMVGWDLPYVMRQRGHTPESIAQDLKRDPEGTAHSIFGSIEDNYGGIGHHFTRNPAMADYIADVKGDKHDFHVVFSGTHNPEDVNTNNDDLTGGEWPEEEETTLLPGSSVNIHQLKIRPSHSPDWTTVPMNRDSYASWERHHTASRRLHTAADEDYRDSHQAPGPEDGAPMHDVTQGIYPASFYDEPFRYWGTDESTGDRDSWGTIHKVRGNPDARVKVHRALPLDVAKRERGIGLAAPLNTGDWVTPSYNYAHEHGMSRLEGNTPWTVVTSTVPASQLHTDGNSLAEWGYNGPPTQGYEGSNAAGKRKYRQQQVRKQQINAETTKDFHHCGFCGSPSGEPCERGCWGKKNYPGERNVRGNVPDQPGVSGGGEIDYDPDALRDIRLSHHTASTDGLRYAAVVEADVADDLMRMRLAGRPKRIKPPWSDFHAGQAYPLQNQNTADLVHMFYSLRDAHRAGEPPADGVTPFADRIPHYEAELLDRHEAGDPEATRWADRGSYVKPDYMDEAEWQDNLRMYPEDYPVDPRPRRRKPTAAVNQDLVDRLSGEFHDWWHGNGGRDPKDFIEELRPRGLTSEQESHLLRGPVGHWPNIENFLKDKYPAAHRGLIMGHEEARTLLDWDRMYPHEEPGGHQRYETGPEAHAQHGYDPKEIAAGMLLLHNKSDRLRGDMSHEDQTRLNDIAQKRFQMQRDYEQRTARLAAVNQDLVDKLHNEFHQWAVDYAGPSEDLYGDQHNRGPIGEWKNVESFLHDRYPAAHKNHDYGQEEAAWALDGHEPMPYQLENQGKEYGSDLTPYATGPEAVAQHGYDPAEIAASMVLLHNQSHPLRGNLAQEDQDRLTDIFTKRQQMQRDYEQRTKTAMPWYHRTDDELNPGDHLLPYNQVHPDHQEVGDELWNPNKAYVYYGEEDDSSDHAPYAGYGQHIYEIEPHDDPQRDYGDGNHSSHMTDGGTVIKRLPDEDPYSFGEEPQWADPIAHKYASRTAMPWSQYEQARNARLAMPAPLPQGTYFRYHPELVWSPGVTAHAPGGKQVGSLEWYDDDHVMVDLGTRRPGEIDRIQVPEDQRGQSIASSMFDFAKQHEPRLHHSDILTEDGRGWSEYEQSRSVRMAMPTVYHGTDPESAQSILQNGFSPGGWGDKSFFSTEPQDAASYGDSLLSVDIPDDEWERTERHPWMHHETAEVDPHRLQELGIKPRLLDEVPRRPLTGPPVWPKVYRKNPDQTWQEGRPVDQVARQIDTDEDLTQMRDVPDWPKGTFDAGAGTYWDVDFGDGPTPVHQRDLYT